MNRFVNCSVVNCGIGFSFGKGVQASMDRCSVTDSGIGYVFHNDSDIRVSRSSSKRNKVGVEVVGRQSHSQRPSNRINQFKDVHFKISGEMFYALLYLSAVKYSINS